MCRWTNTPDITKQAQERLETQHQITAVITDKVSLFKIEILSIKYKQGKNWCTRCYCFWVVLAGIY